MIEESAGSLTLRIVGRKAENVFADESGGHRWQRIPPTERRGRVHTSTVTVAVLPEPTQDEITIDMCDLEISTVRGTGTGGQHRNTSDTCVVIRHIPTGLSARCDNERSQDRNRRLALAVLQARVTEQERRQRETHRANNRRNQVGSGMRGDKRRTIRLQDGRVVDHLTGKRWNLRSYLKGEWR